MVNHYLKRLGIVALLSGGLLGLPKLANKINAPEISANSMYQDPNSYIPFYDKLKIVRERTDMEDIDGDGYKDLIVSGEIPESNLPFLDNTLSSIYFFKGHKEGGYFYPPKLLKDRIPINCINIFFSDLNNDENKDIEMIGMGKGKGFDDAGFGSYILINGKDF